MKKFLLLFLALVFNIYAQTTGDVRTSVWNGTGYATGTWSGTGIPLTGSFPLTVSPVTGTGGFIATSGTGGLQNRFFGGNTIALLGTSLTAQNYSTANNAFSSNGSFTWVNALLGSKFNLIGVGGYSGQNAAYLLTKVPTILALNARWVRVDAGTNDMNDTTNAVLVSGTIAQIWDALTAGGARVIAQSIPPRSDGTGTLTQQSIQKTNVLLEQAAAARGLIYIDNHAVLANASDGKWRTGYDDGGGIHNNTVGAYWWGKREAEILNDLVPYWTDLPSDNISTTGGNLLPNGMMLGDTGGLATNTTRSPAGATPSKVARTDQFGGEWQRLTVTGTTGSFIRQTGTTQIVAGDWVYAVAEVRIGASTNFKAVSATLTVTGGTAPSATGLRTQSTYPNTPESLNGQTIVIRTPAVQMDAGATGIRLQIDGTCDPAGDLVFDVGRCAVYKTSGSIPFYAP